MGIEGQLKRAGKLNGLTDMKEFWDLMLGPPSSPPPSPSPSHPLLASQKLATSTTCRPHPLNEVDEEDDDGDHTSWALTALPPEHYRVRSSQSSWVEEKNFF